jgi:tetratricopeptide (TPR) repeat protein
MHRRGWGFLALVLLFTIVCSAADDATSLVSTADALLAERKFQRARVLYEQALAAGFRFEHDLPHARNLAAAFLNSTPPDLANGIKWLRIALQLDPNNDGLRADLAKVLLRSGDVEGAVNNYQVLVDSHPQSSEYVIGLAAALRQGGKGVASLQLLQAAVEKFPNLLAVRIEYARQLNFTKQFREAKQQFSAVLGRDPDSLIAQVGMAKATSFQGDQETAIAIYDRILRRHPGLYDAIIGKAFALLWSGRTAEARVLFEKGLRRHPDDQEVREALSSLSGSEVGRSRAVPQDSSEQAPRRPAQPASSEDRRRSAGKAATPRQAAEAAWQPGPMAEHDTSTSARLAILLVAAVICCVVAAAVHAVRGARLVKRPDFVEKPAEEDKGPGISLPEIEAPPDTLAVLPALAIEEAAGPAKAVELLGAIEITEQPAPARMRPEVLVIGGSENLAELERRWLEFLGAESLWERNWIEATARLRDAPPDVMVLNAITDDGWTSLRMFNWIATNQAPLRTRSLVIVGAGEFAEFGQFDFEARYLFEPFGASQWQDAVKSMLRLCSRFAGADRG